MQTARRRRPVQLDHTTLRKRLADGVHQMLKPGKDDFAALAARGGSVLKPPGKGVRDYTK